MRFLHGYPTQKALSGIEGESESYPVELVSPCPAEDADFQVTNSDAVAEIERGEPESKDMLLAAFILEKAVKSDATNTDTYETVMKQKAALGISNTNGMVPREDWLSSSDSVKKGLATLWFQNNPSPLTNIKDATPFLSIASSGTDIRAAMLETGTAVPQSIVNTCFVSPFSPNYECEIQEIDIKEELGKEIIDDFKKTDGVAPRNENEGFEDHIYCISRGVLKANAPKSQRRGMDVGDPLCSYTAYECLNDCVSYAKPAVGYLRDINDRASKEGVKGPNVYAHFASHEDLFFMCQAGTYLTNKGRILPTRSDAASVVVGAEPYLMGAQPINKYSPEFLFLCKDNIVSRPIISNSAYVSNGCLNPLEFNYFTTKDLNAIHASIKSNNLPENIEFKIEQAINYVSYIDQIPQPEPAENTSGDTVAIADTSYGSSGAYSILEKNARIAWQASIDKANDFYKETNNNSLNFYQTTQGQEEVDRYPTVTLTHFAAADKSHFLDLRLPDNSEEGVFLAYGYSERSCVSLVSSRPLGKVFKESVEALAQSINAFSSALNRERRLKTIYNTDTNVYRDKVSDKDLANANLPFLRLTKSAYAYEKSLKIYSNFSHPIFSKQKFQSDDKYYLGGLIIEPSIKYEFKDPWGYTSHQRKPIESLPSTEGRSIQSDIVEFSSLIDSLALLSLTSLPIATPTILQKRLHENSDANYTRQQFTYVADWTKNPLYDLNDIGYILGRSYDTIGMGDKPVKEVIQSVTQNITESTPNGINWIVGGPGKLDWTSPMQAPVAKINKKTVFSFSNSNEQKINQGSVSGSVTLSTDLSTFNQNAKSIFNTCKDHIAPRYYNYEADKADVAARNNIVKKPNKSVIARANFGGLFDPVGAGLAVGVGVASLAGAGVLVVAASELLAMGITLSATGIGLTVGLAVVGVALVVIGLAYLFDSSSDGIDELFIESTNISGTASSAKPLPSASVFQVLDNPYSMHRALNMEPYRGRETYRFHLNTDGISPNWNEYSELSVPQIPGVARLANETIAIFESPKMGKWRKSIQRDGSNVYRKSMTELGGEPAVASSNVKVFSLCEYAEVADALAYYFLEAKDTSGKTNLVGSFDLNGRYIPYFRSVASANQGIQQGIQPQISSAKVARKEFYSLRYIALLGSAFEWLLYRDHPHSNKIKSYIFNGISSGGSISSFELVYRMMELLKDEYAPINGVPKFSSAAAYILDKNGITEKTKTLNEIIGAYTSSLEGTEIDQGQIEATRENAFIRFHNLTLGETSPFIQLFKSYADRHGITVAADRTRAQRLRECAQNIDFINRVLNKELSGAPIKDYLESLGKNPDQILDILCNALTNGGKRPANESSLQEPAFLALSQEADLYDQSRIHATISLMTAGAVEPAEWVRRLGASGALTLQTLPIANKEAFIAQIARTAAESGITDVKGLLEEYLPPDTVADVDVDTVIENVGADVTLEQTAIDKAEFEGEQEKASLSSLSTGAKVGIALGVAAAIGGGYWFYKKRKSASNNDASYGSDADAHLMLTEEQPLDATEAEGAAEYSNKPEYDSVATDESYENEED